MNIIKQKKNCHYLYFIILLIIISIQLFRIVFVFTYQREGFHSDESFSYGFANSYYDPYVYSDANGSVKNFNSWISGQVLRDYIEVSDAERFRFDSVYYNQKQDMSPPLYSMILHFICSFFPNTFSWNYAFIINIASFIMTQIVLYLLGYSLSKSRLAALLTCLLYGFTTGALNCFVYLRMYAMLTLLAVLSAYLHSRIYNKQFRHIKWELVAIGFVTVVGVMTHYYFYVFSFFMAIAYCIYLLSLKNWRVFLNYAGTMLLAAGLSLCINPYAIINIYKGASKYEYQMPLYWNVRISVSTLMQETIGIGDIFADRVALVYTMYYFTAFILIVAALCFLFRKEKWYFEKTQSIKKSLNKFFRALVRTFRSLKPTILFLYLTIILTLLVVAMISNVAGMNIYSDRYLFFLMPLQCALIISILYRLINEISSRNVFRQVTLGFMVVALLVTNNSLSGFNYIFPTYNNGVSISELTKDANCIIVELTAKPKKHCK